MDEFHNEHDFAEHRNGISGPLLLPKSFNASHGAQFCEEKHYFGQNLLARSLHPDCYVHNPGFAAFVTSSGLPFRPHATFTMADLQERRASYRKIAERVWDPRRLFETAGSGGSLRARGGGRHLNGV